MNNDLVRDNVVETTKRWKQFNRLLQATICIIGIIIVLSVGYGFFRGARLYQKYVPLIDASMEMRLEATAAYLWFEELLGGDKSKSMDDILKHLDLADWYADAMIKGGESSHLKLQPLDDSHLRGEIKALQSQLTKQRKLIDIRIGAMDESGPGTDIDEVYHETLERFIADADNLEMEVKGLMARNFKIYTLLSLCIVFVCIFLFIVIGYGFYRYESLRKKNYAEIMKMERMLVQSEKMAALGSMIAGMAHEINNPNNFIFFNMPILKEYIQELMPIVDDHARRTPDLGLFEMPYPEFRDDLHKLIDNIENGSKRINQIVSELKQFSRKKDEIRRGWFDVKEVVEKAITICGSQIENTLDSFEINIPDNLPKVYCDFEILKLILINFLLNAAEAADKQNPRIKLNVSLDRKNPKSLIIEVSTNGGSISGNHIEKKFDPFRSTKIPKGSSRRSAGMGLYLSQILAEQMDAHIEVNSESGKGSIFRLKTSVDPDVA